jgi:hypothetical protein
MYDYYLKPHLSFAYKGCWHHSSWALNLTFKQAWLLYCRTYFLNASINFFWNPSKWFNLTNTNYMLFSFNHASLAFLFLNMEQLNKHLHNCGSYLFKKIHCSITQAYLIDFFYVKALKLEANVAKYKISDWKQEKLPDSLQTAINQGWPLAGPVTFYIRVQFRNGGTSFQTDLVHFRGYLKGQ